MININSNFLLQSKMHLDSRKSFNLLSDMAAFLEGAVPEGFITYCVETDKYYKFNSANEVDATTGKWREFSGGGNCIDDTLESSTSKTYSIDKIKELMSKQGGLVPVDVLPDLTIEEERAKIELSKIYLVPNPNGEDPNVKDEYVCIFTEGTSDVYREALVTSDVDYDAWKVEIETYVTGGGALTDDFATYTLTNTTTTMTEQTYAEMVESIDKSDTDYTAYTTRVTSEIVIPAVAESWAWEKIGLRDGGSLEWREDVIVNNPTGKVTNGTNLNGQTVLDIVAKMLTKVEKATVKLVGNPDTKDVIFESGVASITDVGLTATISLGTCTIEDGATITFKKDGVAIGTETYVDGTLTYTYTDTGANIEDDVIYSVEVPYDNEGVSEVAKNEIKYEFEYPIFYGTSATKEIADPTALTKVLSNKEKQTLSYTGTNSYCVIAIPDTKTITSILDQNSFDNSNSFSYVTQSVTLGTTPVIYKIYTNDIQVTCTNFKYSYSIE